MDRKLITKYILEKLNNDHTEIELKDDISGNYYNAITDTIYLAPVEKVKKIKSKIQVNDELGKLITLCHECYHSVQSKKLHIINTVLSVFSIVIFVINIIIAILKISHPIIKIVSGSIIFISIVMRVILELGAIINSLKIAEMVYKDIDNSITEQDIIVAKKYIKKFTLLAILGMILDKLVILLIIILL